ncbi:MAG: lysylphosphatidylglycerol synthase transmembrane domain-containing protein [Victivallales bacterium]|nr:lysylphosphatidylglycerol synthase transmembrane domain-containing protein [Victivallales bacterium]
MQTENSKKSRFKAVISFILKTALAVGIIWWLIHKHYDTFVANLASINFWWLLPAALAYGLHMLVCSWRWYKLARVLEIDITLFQAVVLTMKGYFFSLVIPGGAIGGDIAKIGFLNHHTPKGAKAEGAFSILMDRMTGMAAMFSLALVVILFSVPMLMRVQLEVIELNDVVRALGILGLIGMCLAGLGAILCLFFHKAFEKIRFIGWLMRIGDKYTHGMVSRFTKVIDTYRRNWKLLVKMGLISVFFVHLDVVLVIYFIMRSLGMDGFNPVDVITAVTVGNVAGLLPSNSGLGLRDVTINVILNAAGIPNGATIPIIYSAILVTFNLLAGLFFVFDFSKKQKLNNEL